MIRWSTEMGCYVGEIAVRTSVSEIPVDREFESHQPHIFPWSFPQRLNIYDMN